jgi:hypothetical protein
MARPHDVTDLLLAPVALALDTRLEELGSLSPTELQYDVALEGDKPHRSRAFREAGLLTAVTHNVALHGWVCSWDQRGLRLTHDGHTIVLGLPPSLTAYLADR